MSRISEQATPEAVRLLETLVGFDTTSRGSNLALIDWVRDYLKGFDIESDLIFNAEGDKANLYATMGPSRDGGIVLSGHTDVVPVDGQDWSSDPWTLTERDGNLYGRGSADMKGFIACVLATVPTLARMALSEPVHLAFSYDEEVGCVGVHGIIDFIRHSSLTPRIAIIGEPTELKVVNAHKGTRGIRTVVRGLEAHSSATQLGVNAIAHTAELVAFLDRLAGELRDRASPESRFDPPYTTINVGKISGGTARNIIPKECTIDWDYRVLPGEDEEEVLTRFNAFAEEEVLPRMRDVFAEASITTRVQAAAPPLLPEDGSAAETLAMALAGRNDTHAVSYATEGGVFQQAGLSAVVCGPGSILVAHRPDEYVARDQLTKCLGLLERLAEKLDTGPK